MKDYINQLENLFIKYCKINTRSNPNNDDIPTTQGQIDFSHTIIQDIKKLGIKNISYNPKSGYITITLPSNIEKEVPSIGFVSHLDTADFNAENINPQIHSNYNGNKVLLNKDKNIWLDPDNFPDLKKIVGQTLITTDGTTLLGADDKSGIVGSIGAIKYLSKHPEIKHGTIKFAFGPDEEIGKGAKSFDAEKFNTDFAYTMDNGKVGQIKNETFNASMATIKFNGSVVHPGSAYHNLINSITIARDFMDRLPKDEVPENSKGRQGFFFVASFSGSAEHSKLQIVIRDFDNNKYRSKNTLLKEITDQLNQKYGKQRVNLKITEQYRNINNEIRKYPYIIDLAKRSYQDLGLTPEILPFRGGTDGNFITPKGIPTPNLFNGGGNYHGKYEYITSEDLVWVAKVIIKIAEKNVEYHQ